MAKKSHWPWILSLVVIGWYLGSDVSDTDKSPPHEKQRTVSEPKKRTKVPEIKREDVTEAARRVLGTNVTQRTMYVDADRLNVREGPGTSFKRIWTLKRDEAVAVVREQDEWQFVRGGNFEGWVHGGYLTPKPTPKKIVRQVPTRPKPAISDAKIKRILIERSIALYSGACPCPYNRMRNGRRCGGNSAWSRPGGASPLCYERDVTASMVAAYRARQ